MPHSFQHITILGPGLLGGSIALAARRVGLSAILWGRNPERVAAAMSKGLKATTDLAEAVKGADMVILAVPVGVMDELAGKVCELQGPDVFLTDVGSVKGLPHQMAEGRGLRFVGSHPMAGSEQTGVEAAREDLFDGAACVVTNDAGLADEEVDALAKFWEALGCENVKRMSAAEHDEAVARISHFPHAMSSLTADVSLKDQGRAELAGGGFRDTTRVASGDPAMWAEIMMENKEALSVSLEEVREQIGKMLDQLANSDKEGLQAYLAEVKKRNDEARKVMKESIQVSPQKTISGELAVPGDKSISHRAAILAGLSDGSCRVENFLSSEDCVNTLRAMMQLGVKAEVLKGTDDQPVDLLIHGCGGELQAPSRELDCGNSGTGMRLLAGVLAAQKFDSVLTGDESLSGRPMGRVMIPLGEMGAKIDARGEKKGCAPLHISGGSLKSIDYDMPVASAQVKSAVLLAGLFAPDTTVVNQPATTRDHSERLLNFFGVEVVTEGNRISLQGGQKVKACDLVVPGDVSSAAFWMVAAAVTPGSKLTLTNVGLNPTRTAIITVLKRMGAQITDEVLNEDGGEPRGDIEIVGGQLTGTEILPEEVPNLIDEVPILSVAGALSDGTMTIREAHELRVKETDRIDTVVKNLRAMGGEIEEFEDGMVIPGGQKLHGAQLDSYGDHRIAMAFAIAGLLAESGDTTIANTACVNTSYPTFSEHLAQVSS